MANHIMTIWPIIRSRMTKIRVQCVFFMALFAWASCVYAEDALVDPTRPTSFRGVSQDQAPQKKKMVLQAIIVKQDGNVAIFNSKELKTGDYVGDMRITRISANTVSYWSAAGEGHWALHPPILKPSKGRGNDEHE